MNNLLQNKASGNPMANLMKLKTETQVETVTTDNSQQVFQRNDKLASKLLMNVSKLQDFSSNLQNRLTQQEEEISLKQQAQKQQNAQKDSQIQNKMMNIMNKRQNLQQELDEKQQKLKEAEESERKRKEDLERLLLEKTQQVKDLKLQNLDNLSQKAQTIKDLKEQINTCKEELKQARLKRKLLDDQMFELQELTLNQKQKLAEVAKRAGEREAQSSAAKDENKRLQQENDKLQKQIDDLNQQLELELIRNEQLRKRLEELLRLAEQMRDTNRDNSEMALQIKNLQHKLDQLVKEVLQLDQEYDVLQQKYKNLQTVVEKEKQKLENLKKSQLLIKKMIELEKLLKTVNADGMDIKEKIRRNKVSFEVLIVEFDAFEKFVINKNLSFRENLTSLIKNSIENYKEAENIVSKLRQIDNKIIKKPELNDEEIQEITEDLNEMQKQIKQLNSMNDELIKKLENTQKELKSYQQVTKEKSMTETKQQNKENQGLLDQVQELEAKKINVFQGKHNHSLSNDSEIESLLALLQSFQDQYQRLKKALDHLNSDDFKKLLDDLNNLLKALENLIEQDRIGSKRSKLQGLLDQGDEIDKIIQGLQDRMDFLQEQLDKLDGSSNPENQQVKDDIQKELDELKKRLQDEKNKKEALVKQVEKVMKMSDDELLKFDGFDDLEKGFKEIKDKNLPDIDYDLSQLEDKLNRKMGNQKGDLINKCFDSLKQNQQDLKKLITQLDKNNQEIQKLEKSLQQFQNHFKYPDQERDLEIENGIKEQLKHHKSLHQLMTDQKDNLAQQLKELEQTMKTPPQNLDQHQQIKFWKQQLSNSENLGKDINSELSKAQQQEIDLSQMTIDFSGVQEKYKAKDKLYKQAQDSQRQKQAKIDNFKKSIEVLDQKMLGIEKSLENINLPEECVELNKELGEKQHKADQLRKRLNKLKEKSKEFQDRIVSICQPLGELGNRTVDSKEIQNVIDELNKLNADIQQAMDDLKGFSKDLDDFLKDLEKFLDKSKNYQLEEAAQKYELMHSKVTDCDAKHKECDDKLQTYIQKIKEGVRNNQGEEDVLQELRKLRGEAEDIDGGQRQTGTKINGINQQDRKLKDQLNKMRANTSNPPSNEEIQNYIENVHNVQNDALGVFDGLCLTSEDLDERIAYLDKFLNKSNNIKNMFKDYLQALADIDKNFDQFQKDLEASKLFAEQLRKVLNEMEKGLPRDYLGKDSFIKELSDLVEKAENIMQTLEPEVDKIQDMINEVKANKIESMMDCDVAQLEEIYPRVKEVLAYINNTQAQLQEQVNQLQGVKKTIGVADVPKNIRELNKMLNSFVSKLKQLEQSVDDLKQINSAHPSYGLKDDLILLEQSIRKYRDDKVKFNRIVSQELGPYETTQVSKLDNLKTLRDVIEKVRETGNNLENNLRVIDKDLELGNKLKKQVGDSNINNRWKNLDAIEDALRQRLIKASKRLELIHKCAQDCNGYTSSTEETTFVDSIINEMPELLAQEQQAFAELDEIQNTLQAIKKDLEDVTSEDYTQKVKRIGQTIDEYYITYINKILQSGKIGHAN